MRSYLFPLLLGLVALALLLGAATAHAQPASAPAAAGTAGAGAAPADPGFQPLAPGESAGPPDGLPAPRLVTIAYTLIWVAVVAFLFSLWRRHRRLGDEVAALRARLERANRDG
jgi:hypothetical protein